MDKARLTLKKVVNATIEEVFEAFTNAEIMRTWFCPSEDMTVEVENHLKVGGTYSLNMYEPDGKVYNIVGEYLEIAPSEKLVFTWNNEFVEDSIVTITFSEINLGTEITLIHDLFPDEEVKEIHSEGWTGLLNRASTLFDD